MRILAIETSCDETALAIVSCEDNHSASSVILRESGGSKRTDSRWSLPSSGIGGGNDNISLKVLAEVVSSQIKVHRPYGGVVPALAKREHLKNLPILLKKIFKSYKPAIAGLYDFDSIAVTVGPGLEPALWTGINFANELGRKLKVPVVGINHLEGHIYSNWLPPSPIILNKIRHPERLAYRQAGSEGSMQDSSSTTKVGTQNDARVNIAFPAIVLVVSGGHTILLKMNSMKKWKKLGETRDDAVGEAFDKVAKMLKLPYPGGPEVEKLSQKGNPNSINFPRPMINNKNYDFSFSGLKTAVLYYLRGDRFVRDKVGTRDDREMSLQGANRRSNLYDAANVAASFQQAAVDVLAVKTIRAAKEFEAKSILLCGGVAANKVLQNRLKEESKKLGVKFYVPELKYNTDNAVMIAIAACLGKSYPTNKALPNLNL